MMKTVLVLCFLIHMSTLLLGQYLSESLGQLYNVKPSLTDSSSIQAGVYSFVYGDNQIEKALVFNDTRFSVRASSIKNNFIKNHIEYGFNFRAYKSNFEDKKFVVSRKPFTVMAEPSVMDRSYLLTPEFLLVYKALLFEEKAQLNVGVKYRFNKGGKLFKVDELARHGFDVQVGYVFKGVDLSAKLIVNDYEFGKAYYFNAQDLKYTLPGSFFVGTHVAFSYTANVTPNSYLKPYFKLKRFRTKKLNHAWQTNKSSERYIFGVLFENSKYYSGIEIAAESLVIAQYSNNGMRRRVYSVLGGYKLLFLDFKTGFSYIADKVVAFDQQSLNSDSKEKYWLMHFSIGVVF